MIDLEVNVYSDEVFGERFSPAYYSAHVAVYRVGQYREALVSASFPAPYDMVEDDWLTPSETEDEALLTARYGHAGASIIRLAVEQARLIVAVQSLGTEVNA